MTPTNDIPRIIRDAPADGKGYKLTPTQRDRAKRGASVWERDRVVEPYDVRKGKWV